MSIKSVKLHCTTGGSDKIYFVAIRHNALGGYDVYAEYGRRGSTMNGAIKNTNVTKTRAEAAFNSLVHQKEAKGYVVIEENGASANADPTLEPDEKINEIFPQLLNDIDDVEKYLRDFMYVAEEKHDGERRMIVIGRDLSDVYGTNKKGKRVVLPQVVVDALDPDMYDTILDGEIIGDKYFSFDVLSDEDTRSKPYIIRKRSLEHFQFGDAIQPTYTAVTEAEKRALYERLKVENREGIVFKRQNAPYEPGRPNSGGNQLKFKFVASATCRVISQNGDKRSVGLAMYDESADEIPVGNVTIPVNHEIPADRSFVEVQYLYAYKGGSLYQPVYLGSRTDCFIGDCNISQLKYKPD